MTTLDRSALLDVSAAFEQLGRIALAEHTMESVLQQVCDLAGQVLPGEPAVSVSVTRHAKAGTLALRGDLARTLDETQYQRGFGPCLDAIESGESVRIDDNRSERRWPSYTEAAVRAGCLSSLSVPLFTREDVGAGLNLYAREAATFTDETGELATRFARYAAVAVANMQAYQAAVLQGQHLQTALQSRAVIDQAKGILMERHKKTADEAFQLLAALSMRRNVKLREIAERVVHTGELETS